MVRKPAKKVAKKKVVKKKVAKKKVTKAARARRPLLDLHDDRRTDRPPRAVKKKKAR